MKVTSPVCLRRGTLSAMLTPDGRRAERAWRRPTGFDVARVSGSAAMSDAPVASASRIECSLFRLEYCFPPPDALWPTKKVCQSVPSKLGLEAAPRVKSGHLESCA